VRTSSLQQAVALKPLKLTAGALAEISFRLEVFCDNATSFVVSFHKEMATPVMSPFSPILYLMS
jgi:hypothetical protein